MARKSKIGDIRKKEKLSNRPIKLKDRGWAELKTYYNTAGTVYIDWRVNEHARDNQLFVLKIDGKEVVLDAEELQYYLRNV